jgi:hypothetical protein
MASITLRMGSEGPKHDPYHYDEIRFTSTDKSLSVVFHNGLAEWLTVGRVIDGRTYSFVPVHAGYKDLRRFFEYLTGLTPEGALRAIHQRKERRLRAHRKHDVNWKSGFPGEAFLYCSTCGDVLDSTFNRSAIE